MNDNDMDQTDERMTVDEARRVLEYAVRESGVNAHEELEFLYERARAASQDR